MPKFVMKHEYIPVSCYFIDNFLKDTSGIFLKVYLYALNLAINAEEIDTGSIAEALSVLESDVLQAFTFWKNAGMIIEENGVVEFTKRSQTTETKENQTEEHSSNDTGTAEKRHYDSIEVAQKISENSSLSELVLVAQELLAKPLTTPELETVYWFFDELGYSVEAILLIIDYCISREKRNIKYIEKVAIAWHEKGIKTAEQIMECIAQEEARNGILYKIKKGMGINDRALSQAEEQYISKWYNDYSISEEMILLAYEYCLLNTTKLSFPYIDKIIERWYKQGIKTKEEAEVDNKNHKTKSNGDNSVFSDEFNHISLEKLTRNGLKNI